MPATRSRQAVTAANIFLLATAQGGDGGEV